MIKSKFCLLSILIFVYIPSFAKDLDLNQTFKSIESKYNRQIGVYAIDTNTSKIIKYNESRRFAIQSTMKVIGVAALLKLSEKSPEILNQKVFYTKKDLSYWSIITKYHLYDGMTFLDLAEAAVTFSDNTAINLILKKFGGPSFSTKFANSIGNNSYNISHYEGFLNSDNNNVDDTSTPKDMALSIKSLLIDNTLESYQKNLLYTWMRNCTTSYKDVRASVPPGYIVADKTGTGDFGVRNDVGIIIKPGAKPIIFAIYTSGYKKNDLKIDEVLSDIGLIIVDTFK